VGLGPWNKVPPGKTTRAELAVVGREEGKKKRRELQKKQGA